MAKKGKKKQLKRQNVIIGTIAVVVLVAVVAALAVLRGQKMANRETVTLYIATGSDYATVVDSLEAHGCIGNKMVFNTMARIRNYKDNVKGGCYVLKPEDKVWNVLTKLYCGNQDAIRLTINKYRTKRQLCDYIGRRLEMESDTLLQLLEDEAVCAEYGFNKATIIGMFPQNTYEIYWNTTPQQLIKRMAQERDRFWNAQRTAKAKALGMNKEEVYTLASIVDAETANNAEKPTVAGLYLNRLKKGMLLQADPTVKFALQDFGLRRIYGYMLTTPSPYNTYLHKGLPPGPIRVPQTSSIDAVLNAATHDYLYMCANSDFSGTHAFAATYSEHLRNAARYVRALNERGIK